VLSEEVSSTDTSSESLQNNQLKTPNCPREAGVGGSNPLAPI
jgi:hypothetical protein